MTSANEPPSISGQDRESYTDDQDRESYTVPCVGCGGVEMPLDDDDMCQNCRDLDARVDNEPPTNSNQDRQENT